MKIIILEFTPCADAIYHIRRDVDEGYEDGDRFRVRIKTGVKIRPRLASAYAGGKATNVARLIDRLLGEEDAEVELIVFRPDSAEGRYLHDLQTGALNRVSVRPVIIQGEARFCMDFTDPSTDPADRVEFNVSPRAVWEEGTTDIALELASRLSADVLIMAGNPPAVAGGRSPESGFEMAVDLYARVIERVRPRVGVISLDTEKQALARCLESKTRPDVIKINAQEYASVDEGLWDNFAGTLVVTDAAGCRVRERAIDSRIDSRIAGPEIQQLYSRVGAGDAMHAGFTVARWVRGYDTLRAVRYALATAATSVSNPEGTRGVRRDAVENLFKEIDG
jgi:fructose-1-phosphate kinase PfkB-like protein